MGIFRIPIEVGDPQGQRWVTVRALVDSGASDTRIPGSLLEGLGVQPVERWPFDLADGRTIEYDLGETRVRIDGRVSTTRVVFGEENAEALLGAYTLEGLHLAVDPVHRRLIPVPGLLM